MSLPLVTNTEHHTWTPRIRQSYHIKTHYWSTESSFGPHMPATLQSHMLGRLLKTKHKDSFHSPLSIPGAVAECGMCLWEWLVCGCPDPKTFCFFLKNITQNIFFFVCIFKSNTIIETQKRVSSLCCQHIWSWMRLAMWCGDSLRESLIHSL